MHRLVNLFVGAAAAGLPVAGPVVEIGAYQVPGQEQIADLRPYFPGLEYVGTDMRPGPGVDRVEDVHDLTFASGSIGTMLMMETLEHVARPERAIAEARRTLRPDGLLIVSTPFALGIHNYPNDYWRFTPEAFDLLLADFPARLIGSVGPEYDPLFVMGIAFAGGDVPAERAESVVARYRQALAADPVLARERRKSRIEFALARWTPLPDLRRGARTRARALESRFRFVAPPVVPALHPVMGAV